MFTGIVEELGTVREVRPGRLIVAAKVVLEGVRLGDSIAVNGACLTVAALGKGVFSVDVVVETLRRTNLSIVRPGDVVNLERALPYGGRVGGHLVQGHVEGTAKVLSVAPEGANSFVTAFRPPRKLMRFIVGKGFVAVDGVSLTVVDCTADGFRVSLVPYTLAHTTLGRRRPGDLVNIEADILAKYVERLLAHEEAEPSAFSSRRSLPLSQRP
ncbi:MAG: riboflavin synthase [Chloroflexi bacterium]|nr:riboflavin synthase [Chloroflexota bacterium]